MVVPQVRTQWSHYTWNGANATPQNSTGTSTSSMIIKRPFLLIHTHVTPRPNTRTAVKNQPHFLYCFIYQPHIVRGITAHIYRKQRDSTLQLLIPRCAWQMSIRLTRTHISRFQFIISCTPPVKYRGLNAKYSNLLINKSMSALKTTITTWLWISSNSVISFAEVHFARVYGGVCVCVHY